MRTRSPLLSFNLILLLGLCLNTNHHLLTTRTSNQRMDDGRRLLSGSTDDERHNERANTRTNG